MCRIIRQMSKFGYFVAILYLGYSGFALYSLKGITWLLVSLLGPLAFFPIWAYLLIGYSEPGVWIMFLYLLFDSYLNFKKRKNVDLQTFDEPKENEINDKTINPVIKELEEKLNQISEEEKISELREQLNQKRIDRGLLPLLELEKLENKIKDLQNTYERKKRSRKHTQDKSSYLKPRRNTGSAILFVASAYSFYSMINSGIPALISGIIFWIVGVSFFYYINKKIKFFKNKSNTLSAEIKDLEIHYCTYGIHKCGFHENKLPLFRPYVLQRALAHIHSGNLTTLKLGEA